MSRSSSTRIARFFAVIRTTTRVGRVAVTIPLRLAKGPNRIVTRAPCVTSWFPIHPIFRLLGAGKVTPEVHFGLERYQAYSQSGRSSPRGRILGAMNVMAQLQWSQAWEETDTGDPPFAVRRCVPVLLIRELPV